MDRLLASNARDGDMVLAASGGTAETGLMMSTGSTSSLTFISGTGGPNTEEGLPPTAAVGRGAAAMAAIGGVTGTAPGTVERAAAGCDGGLAAIIVGMAGGGC